jgi:hypothetical protein
VIWLPLAVTVPLTGCVAPEASTRIGPAVVSEIALICPHREGAIQSLVWAIEEIAKTGNNEAEHHARLALKYLQPPKDEPISRKRP